MRAAISPIGTRLVHRRHVRRMMVTALQAQLDPFDDEFNRRKDELDGDKPDKATSKTDTDTDEEDGEGNDTLDEPGKHDDLDGDDDGDGGETETT